MLRRLIISCCWLLAAASCLAFSQCDAPTELRTELAKKYPEWKVVTPNSLSKDDLHIWRSLHPKDCPGILRGKFMNGEEAFVVALIQGRPSKIREQVLLFKRHGSTIRPITLVSPTNLTIVNVLTKLPPGHYTGVDGEKIRTKTDAIAVIQLEARALLFYWDGTQFKSLQWSY